MAVSFVVLIVIGLAALLGVGLLVAGVAWFLMASNRKREHIPSEHQHYE